jgi:hypothetical protein
MKMLLLRAVVMARRRVELAESTRRSHQRPARPRSERRHGAGSHQSARQAGCENVTAGTEATCSPSWIIPTHRPTTTAANPNCGQLQRTGNRWLSVKLGRRFVRRQARRAQRALRHLPQRRGQARILIWQRDAVTSRCLGAPQFDTTDLAGNGLRQLREGDPADALVGAKRARIR